MKTYPKNIPFLIRVGWMTGWQLLIVGICMSPIGDKWIAFAAQGYGLIMYLTGTYFHYRFKRAFPEGFKTYLELKQQPPQ